MQVRAAFIMSVITYSMLSIKKTFKRCETITHFWLRSAQNSSVIQESILPVLKVITDPYALIPQFVSQNVFHCLGSTSGGKVTYIEKSSARQAALADGYRFEE